MQVRYQTALLPELVVAVPLGEVGTRIIRKDFEVVNTFFS